MAQRSKKKPKILLVDDDPEVLEMYGLLLREAGYEVDEAEHALAAVAAIVRSPPDIILADIRMPIVDGLGLALELKAHADSRQIPLVAVTGYDSAGSREAAIKAGYDEYFTKPIDPRQFPQQIAQIILNHQEKRQAKTKG